MRPTTLAILVFAGAAALLAQPKPYSGSWRGAQGGGVPCVGSDGGMLPCPAAQGVKAIRAGRLFDSKTGQMLTKQVIVTTGDRISEVGPEGQVKIPANAQVIDLRDA